MAPVPLGDRSTSPPLEEVTQLPSTSWTQAPIFEGVNGRRLPLASSFYRHADDKPLNTDLQKLRTPGVLLGRGYPRMAYPSLESVICNRSPHPSYLKPQPQVLELLQKGVLVITEYCIPSACQESSTSTSTPGTSESHSTPGEEIEEPRSEHDNHVEDDTEQGLDLRTPNLIRPRLSRTAVNVKKKQNGANEIQRPEMIRPIRPRPEPPRADLGDEDLLGLTDSTDPRILEDGSELLGTGPLGIMKKERVMLCGMSPPGEPTLTCGVFASHFHDLYRHRLCHLMWETRLRERAEIRGQPIDTSKFVFGGFEPNFPTCKICGRRFSRYDSLQRHLGKSGCGGVADIDKHKDAQQLRLERMERELHKSETLQHWIRTPVPRPKIVWAKVAYTAGIDAHRDLRVLEIFEVEETYAPRYQVVTVKNGKECQIKLFNHDEPGGVPFFTRQHELVVPGKRIAMADWSLDENRALNTKDKGKGRARR
ncbi:hypothetical protein DACRYDRAFT_109535 [Dacryopinax primogenitus]|uniref:Uncharacterized protein n=1 Tax=Dacryopinax primogenitus (strain DJM 731) TaxID=1858805 RepID=M5FWQ1_DACPD|nr:uncharacterized protein DACRYDRAFT_109535 [Dacryopinax primogenitus]EJU00115.1 hypothetical protein DACRYDRAFT_109535 [Dacryopinax primogenitus]